MFEEDCANDKVEALDNKLGDPVKVQNDLGKILEDRACAKNKSALILNVPLTTVLEYLIVPFIAFVPSILDNINRDPSGFFESLQCCYIIGVANTDGSRSALLLEFDKDVPSLDVLPDGTQRRVQNIRVHVGGT